MAATKGGVLKTSLTACLAVHAVELGGRVAIVDLDPQASLSRWWALRKRPGNPRLLVEPRELASDVALLKSQGWQYIFIDTPPGNIDLVEEAVAAADLAIVPSRPSPVDMAAMQPTIHACRNAGTRFAMVVNCYDPSWKISASAADALRVDGLVLDPPIHYRAAYTSAMTLGKTGPESQDRKQAKACRAEITALWASILKVANGE